MMKRFSLKNIFRKNTSNSIDKFLESDPFAAFDPIQHIMPHISCVDYFRLEKMDFNWIILKPMSDTVAKYSEINKLPLADSIKILSPEQKFLYFWWYLDGQVTNGGFSQFIYNGYDKYFVSILNGLKLLENKAYYILVEKVFRYYLQTKLYNTNRSATEYFEDKFYENPLLSEADNEYFKINDQLYKDTEIFIRNNIEKFAAHIKKDFTGIATETKGNISETLEVMNGIADGIYQQRIDNEIKMEIIYKNGQISQQRNFSEGILTNEQTFDFNDNRVKYISDYYNNGQIKEYNKRIYYKGNNYNLAIQNRFYGSGQKKAERWIDEDEVNHVKRYFNDGSIRSYHTYAKAKNDSYDQIIKYLICFDENKNQTLVNGNGVFFDYDVEEDKIYDFYKTIINCIDYMADGESLTFKNDKLLQKAYYLKGYKNGLNTEYDKDGNIESRREFKNGKYIRTL